MNYGFNNFKLSDPWMRLISSWIHRSDTREQQATVCFWYTWALHMNSVFKAIGTLRQSHQRHLVRYPIDAALLNLTHTPHSLLKLPHTNKHFLQFPLYPWGPDLRMKCILIPLSYSKYTLSHLCMIAIRAGCVKLCQWERWGFGGV